jgi:hypothetical protein
VDKAEILDRIRRGRTDLVFELLRLPDWRSVLGEGPFTPAQWFVYYGDVTALKAVLEAGGDLGLDLDRELGHAAFFGPRPCPTPARRRSTGRSRRPAAPTTSIPCASSSRTART